MIRKFFELEIFPVTQYKEFCDIKFVFVLWLPALPLVNRFCWRYSLIENCVIAGQKHVIRKTVNSRGDLMLGIYFCYSERSHIVIVEPRLESGLITYDTHKSIFFLEVIWQSQSFLSSLNLMFFSDPVCLRQCNSFYICCNILRSMADFKIKTQIIQPLIKI